MQPFCPSDAQGLLHSPSSGDRKLAYDLMGVFVNLSIGKVLPQIDLISPRVKKRSVCAAELGPKMVPPENGPSETVCSLENPIEGIIFTYQYPSPYCPTSRIEVGRFGRFWGRMGPHVGRVGDPHVKVAGRPCDPSSTLKFWPGTIR